VFVVFGGIYSSHSDWIEFETITAFAQNKPIIGVMPWAQQRCSSLVQSYNSELVRWNSDSICEAILKHMPLSRRLALESKLEPRRHLARLMQQTYERRTFNALLQHRF